MLKQMGFVCLLVASMAAQAAEIPEMGQVAARPFTASVPVNCAAGQSVQAAIDANAGPVEVVISGFCTENVLIRDKDVTLRGATGPAADGIRSAVKATPALTVRGDGIDTIANLAFDKSAGPAVMIREANVTISNCELASNGGTALNVAMGAFVLADSLVFDGNVGRSMNVTDAQLFCTACDVAGNNFAVVATRGAVASLNDSVVTGGKGILATDGGTLADLDCLTATTTHACRMSVSGVGAQAVGGATLSLAGTGDFTGQVIASEGGTVALIGARQSVGSATNIADFFGRIAVVSFTDGPAPIASQLLSTNAAHFAQLVVADDSAILGTVQCTTAADAVLDPTAVNRAKFTGCEHVSSLR
jgi:hypothetical protein